ncbi:MAG TPA: phosphotransferase, partial [Xanthomonadales bacterium]|nr:phosphotransferase [Xanthomonadales bacterium]
MERRFPIVDVGLDVAGRLLRSASEPTPPRSIELLPGGHVNTNYAVCLEDDRRVVLRIGSRGAPALRREVALLRSLADDAVPVPAVRFADFAPNDFAYPYAVLDWIQGIPLTEALGLEPGAAAQIGEAVAGVLATIE